jgi:hypothetical protein
LSPEIAAVLADPMLAEKPLVVEVNLETDSPDLTAEMRTPLESVVLGSTIEGYVGRFATVRLPKASDVLQLAKYSEARMIRLPPRASETAANDDSEAPVPTIPSVIEKTNLATLQGLGHRGQGVRVVVIGSEFPGLEVVTENQPTYPGLVKVKTAGIPKAWFYDFTAEPNPDVQPLPASANPNLSAIAAATALAGTASEAHVLLVRVDPSAFHQMQSIARAVLGTAGYTLALQARLSEISVESQRLLARRRVVVEEYRRAFTDLSDDEIPTKRREAATIAMKKVQADEALLKARIDRFLNLKQGLESLAGSRIVLNTLVWEEGQPHDSLSPLSQLIESAFANGAARSAIKPDRNPPPPVWIQAASTDRGQIWSGPFMDPDQNQVLNLSAEQSKLPVGRWTNELNFLSYEAVGAPPTSTIPQGTKVRIAVQWREPHNRDTFLIDEPSFPLTLRLFRQIDPTGKVHATDDLVEVARSAGIPARLLKTPGSGVYETILETTLPVDGVYALRIEGGLKGLNVVPAARLGFEIRPRVALTTGDRTKGRVTFETFLPEQSGVGIPADASEAITVGARIGDKLLSLTGAGPGIELRTKPEIYSTPRILVGNQAVQGSAVSAGYTAGIGACLASLGVRKADVTSSIGIKAGSDLILPLDWLRTFPPLRSK